MVKNVIFEQNFLHFVKFHFFAGQECQFWAKFLRQLKISGFSQISFFAGPEWSNSQFWSKFSPRLKISEFCQISSFACSERSKMSVLSRIFNTTENFRILPNFILCRSLEVKNVNFEPNFQLDSKCLHFAKFILACSEWSNMSVLSQLFNTTENFRILPNFILHRSGVVKTLNFEPKFQHNWKFLDVAKFHLSHV